MAQQSMALGHLGISIRGWGLRDIQISNNFIDGFRTGIEYKEEFPSWEENVRISGNQINSWLPSRLPASHS